MSLLQSLSPEQIEALKMVLSQNNKSEDIIDMKYALKIVLSQNNKLEDIVNMKYYFKQLKYYNGDAKYNEKEAEQFRKLLLKYPEEQFYITFEFTTELGDSKKNYNIHLADEMQKLLPTGVNLNEICYSGHEYESYKYFKDDRKIKFVDCPHQYKTDIENGEIRYILQLTHCHSNLHIVHPKIIEAAKFFFH